MDVLAGVTAQLTAAIVRQSDAPMDPAVRSAAERSLLNVAGTAVGASDQPAMRIVLEHARRHGGPPVAAIPGRAERTDAYHAALLTGLAAHLDDFDDTHLETVLHPGAATLAAVVATVHEGDPRCDVLTAFALGCEVQLRVGAAMSPGHYDRGWHITGTCGAIGAATAAGLLLGLDRDGLDSAIATATARTLGVRDAFGTMTKPFHPGKAAANGVVAARLARAGVLGPTSALERPQGFFAALSDDVDRGRITDGWGDDWELVRNMPKPYPCGIVIHPVIDAALALHHEVVDHLDAIDEVVVRCHPLVVDLTGNPDPVDGLEARFSAIHGAAIGLALGRAGLAEYADDVVRSPTLIDLRARTRLVPDTSVARDAARIEVRFPDGVRSSDVAHARGSLERPLTDAELHAKVRALVEPVLPGRTDALIRAVEQSSSGSGTDVVEALTGTEPTGATA